MSIRLFGRGRVPTLLLVSSLVAGLGGGPASHAEPATAGFARLRWLSDLGAESLAASLRPDAGGANVVLAAVPGAAYVLSIGTDGSLVKRLRLAADPSAPYGVAATEAGLVLADRQGTVSLWTFSAGTETAWRWTRDIGDRVTSVGWEGGNRVLVATWKGRMVALAAADGRPLWSADIGGRAEAPGVIDGGDVLVATKGKLLLRLDAATGALRWKASLPGLAVHPVALLGQSPRLVVCGTWDGQLLAFEAETGRLRWSAALPERLAGAPVALSGAVAAVTADGTIHVYDSAGVSRWTTPDGARGPGTLLRWEPAGAAPKLLAVSKALAELDPATGKHPAGYPEAAVAELRQKFAEAMLEGVKTYSEAEKRALLEKDAFEIAGSLFGPARLFGPRLAFGTEDGWMYLFDVPALRPLARYQAGQACSGRPRLVAGQVLAVAGEELFALEPLTGRTRWRRVLGADPGRIAGDPTLAVSAGGRVHAVDASDGSLLWSLRGAFRSVTPPSASEPGTTAMPWLADDGEGNLRALLPPGRIVGDPLPVGGSLVSVLALPGGSWLTATREGRLFGVTWEDGARGPEGASGGRLVRGWEMDWNEPIVELHLAERRLLVRGESGSLAGLDASSRQETWRMPLAREDRIQVLPQADAVAVLGGSFLRIHDLGTGESKFQQSLPSPAVGVDLRGSSLRWLDRAGDAHWVDILGGSPDEASDLGLPLAEALAVPGGFLVTTPAGEVGFVDVADGGPAGTSVEGPARNQ
jgi:outer membrane protein assembly factor BamB